MHELLLKPLVKVLCRCLFFEYQCFENCSGTSDVSGRFMVSRDLKIDFKTSDLVTQKETACQCGVRVLCLKLQLWPSEARSQ